MSRLALGVRPVRVLRQQAVDRVEQRRSLVRVEQDPADVLEGVGEPVRAQSAVTVEDAQRHAERPQLRGQVEAHRAPPAAWTTSVPSSAAMPAARSPARSSARSQQRAPHRVLQRAPPACRERLAARGGVAGDRQQRGRTGPRRQCDHDLLLVAPGLVGLEVDADTDLRGGELDAQRVEPDHDLVAVLDPDDAARLLVRAGESSGQLLAHGPFAELYWHCAPFRGLLSRDSRKASGSTGQALEPCLDRSIGAR